MYILSLLYGATKDNLIRRGSLFLNLLPISFLLSHGGWIKICVFTNISSFHCDPYSHAFYHREIIQEDSRDLKEKKARSSTIEHNHNNFFLKFFMSKTNNASQITINNGGCRSSKIWSFWLFLNVLFWFCGCFITIHSCRQFSKMKWTLRWVYDVQRKVIWRELSSHF